MKFHSRDESWLGKLRSVEVKDATGAQIAKGSFKLEVSDKDRPAVRITYGTTLNRFRTFVVHIENTGDKDAKLALRVNGASAGSVKVKANARAVVTAPATYSVQP